MINLNINLYLDENYFYLFLSIYALQNALSLC